MLVCFFHLHARLRVHWASGIPCALCFLGAKRFLQNSGASRRGNAQWYLKLFRLFENVNRPRVQNSRRPGQASIASADPGPITTDVCCYAKLGLQRAHQQAFVVMGPAFARTTSAGKRLVRRSSTSDRVRRSSQSEGGRRKRRSNPLSPLSRLWIASRSLSSGAPSAGPVGSLAMTVSGRIIASAVIARRPVAGCDGSF